MNLRIVDQYRPFLGKRHASLALALALVAKKKAPLIVELGTSRSYVPGGHRGCMDDDPTFWRPELWDWGAGVFSRVCAEAIEGSDARLISVDPSERAIRIAQTMTSGIDAHVRFRRTTSTAFLRELEEPIDLLYMDHHETGEEGARLHRRDAELLLTSGLLADDGVVLIDDVHVYGRGRERAMSLFRRLVGSSELHHGKGKYSIPFLRRRGFDVLYEGYQVVMSRAHGSAPPTRSSQT